MNDDTTLRIERIVDAPPDVVFRAWTTPAAMEQWYRDRDDFVVSVTEHDLRVGGRYRVEFGPPGEQPYVEHGTFLEINPPHKLVMAMTLEVGDGGWPDTTLTVVFEARDGKTNFTLVHEGFPSREARDDASGGWPGFLDRIEDLVAR